MPALMVQGCTSWSGKSWLATALCRWFARQGLSVAPFKAQNMSNNARVVRGGGEIGAAQWHQALAAGVEPDVRMNPVLVKPEADGSQVVVRGQVDPHLSALPYQERARLLWPQARDALDELLDAFDVVVIEGAGSPAEINLAALDIANMRTAAHADAPVLLVADIDRGGAFAHLYGTWALLDEPDRARIAGFVLNRFRGDPALLAPGPQMLEERTGVRVLGTVPLVEHDLPDEDGAALHRVPRRGGLPRVHVVRYPRASNLDEFTALEQVAEIVWVAGANDLAGAELVILPGSKHVTADLAWLRDHGLANALVDAVAKGTRLLGICGGAQMLGEHLQDEADVDGDADGLGLLPLTTTFVADKHYDRRSVAFSEVLPAPWQALAGRRADGYELRHGRVVCHEEGREVADAGAWARGHVLGWLPHGLLEEACVLEAIFGRRPTRTLEDTFEMLADLVDEHLDTAPLSRLARAT